jgi:hypothetical protein
MPFGLLENDSLTVDVFASVSFVLAAAVTASQGIAKLFCATMFRGCPDKFFIYKLIYRRQFFACF